MSLQKLAGILDKKGSLSVGFDNGKSGTGYYYEQIRISGDPEELELFKEEFGGSVSSNGLHCKRIWRVTSDKALNALKLMKPFIKIKKDTINALIKFGDIRNTYGGVSIVNTKDYNQKRELFLNFASRFKQAISESKSGEVKRLITEFSHRRRR